MQDGIEFHKCAYLTWNEEISEFEDADGFVKSLRGPRKGLSEWKVLNSDNIKEGSFIQISLYIVKDAK